jgi:hypothetical protein
MKLIYVLVIAFPEHVIDQGEGNFALTQQKKKLSAKVFVFLANSLKCFHFTVL